MIAKMLMDAALTVTEVLVFAVEHSDAAFAEIELGHVVCHVASEIAEPLLYIGIHRRIDGAGRGAAGRRCGVAVLTFCNDADVHVV